MNSNERKMSDDERRRIAEKLKQSGVDAGAVIDPADEVRAFKVPPRVKGTTRTESPKAKFKPRHRSKK